MGGKVKTLFVAATVKFQPFKALGTAASVSKLPEENCTIGFTLSNNVEVE